MSYFLLSSLSLNIKQNELNDEAFLSKLSEIDFEIKVDETLGLICEFNGVSEETAIEIFEDVYWNHFHPNVGRI